MWFGMVQTLIPGLVFDIPISIRWKSLLFIHIKSIFESDAMEGIPPAGFQLLNIYLFGIYLSPIGPKHFRSMHIVYQFSVVKH